MSAPTEISKDPHARAPDERVITLREFEPGDHERLVAMYLTYEPKCAFLGLPPTTEGLTRKWLDELRGCGAVFFVMDVGERLAGHAMLCPSGAGTAELAIFVHQDYRGQGLGEKLLLGVLNHACKKLQLRRVWLSVQGANATAVSLFKKAGFRSRGQGDSLRWELELERPLSCKPCLNERCAIFSEALPARIIQLGWK